MNPADPVTGYDSLTELALDLRWSWHHGSDDIWRTLNAALWDLTPHPFTVLQSVPRADVERRLAEPAFRERVDALLQAKRQRATAPAWFQRAHGSSALTQVAYFSMEFMLSGSLPIYSGGLGNVAGDQLKTASDLGVPVVAVGLLYQKGYFRQVIDRDGAQQAQFPDNDPGRLPITAWRNPDGSPFRLELAWPGYSLWLRVWLAQVGRCRLILLDSNDPANSPEQRAITGELYGGGPETRLQQEIILGIGGWRVLGALGIRPEVCHLNEGHAAFAVLERAGAFMADTGRGFAAALTATRVGNLFTTHTAVAAGFDRFAPDLIGRHLGAYAGQRLGLRPDDLLALGRQNPGDGSEPFNLAYLAIRGSGAVNAVSRLHGEVSRRLFAPLFPGRPLEEVPVGHITNGVHMPTWDSAASDAVWTESCGKERWLGALEAMADNVRRVPDARLWEMRTQNRRATVDYARGHVARHMAAAGAAPDAIEHTCQRLNPDVLTLGFARRFASYKRPNLLLHDPERLMRLLANRERPVQLIISGKAHPADQTGQALIREWTGFIRRGPPAPPVVFLADYDMLVAERLVQGVDVWLNTPRRPWEASGTSGMKVLVNGGLNLSELDGWWAEASAPDVGWALGDGREHGEDPGWDAAEATALYERLEREVIPEFYTRNEHGIPVAWVARVRESMARLTPQYSANRTVREYTEQHYLPAASGFRQRSAERGASAQAMVDWRGHLEEKWSGVSFGAGQVARVGDRHEIAVEIFLPGLEPGMVRVELYADGLNGGGAVREEMTRVGSPAGRTDAGVYRATVPAARPASDYTARVLPRYDALSIPLETGLIKWQR